MFGTNVDIGALEVKISDQYVNILSIVRGDAAVLAIYRYSPPEQSNTLRRGDSLAIPLQPEAA